MRLKPSVRFGNSGFPLLFAAMVCNSVMIKHGYEFVITSANDGEHQIDSLHYSDEAFDFRSHDIPLVERKQAILKEIKESLTQDFDVIIEKIGEAGEHFHLEYDRK